MVNRKFTNISCKALGQLISLKDSASRKVAKNSVYNKDSVYYLPAIRLFILLNFKVYTKDGKSSELVIKDLAAEIGCCKKTVLSALERLSSGKEPLIDYSIDEETKLLSVELLNYTDMFKRTGEGGLRYIVFNYSLYEELLNIKNVNEMRLCLRSMIECEEQGGEEASLTLKQILAGMPSYIRPCNIREYFKRLPEILKSTSNKNNSSFFIELSFLSKAKAIRNKLVHINMIHVKNIIDNYNEKIRIINDSNLLVGNHEDSKMSPAVANDVNNILHVSFDWRKAKKDNQKFLPAFHFKSDQFEDAALIATQLDIDSVAGALKKYMESFVLTGRGSKRTDTMAIIQNIAENIYMKNKTFFSGKSAEEIDETFDDSDILYAT